MTGRVRVLLLIKGLGVGGAERLLSSLVEVGDREAFDYRVAYLLPWKDALVPELRAHGVPVTCLGATRTIGAWPARLRRFLTAQPVDVLHVHSPLVCGVARLVVRTLPRRLRPRLVSTEHIPWSGCSRPTRLLNAATFRCDQAHFAVSEDVRSSVPARHRGAVETLVHGVVVGRAEAARASRAAVRAELGASADDVLVGTVANYRRQKAYPDLLEAARLALESGAPVRFVAVGQGPLEQEVHRLHRDLGLGERFLLLGRRDDALRVMAGCDLFALASHYEGYPVAVMEALALGLPVVATRVGGLPDAVRDGVEGLLVAPAQPALLAARIVELARDPQRRARMSGAALVRGRDFDIARAAARLETVYRELVNPGRVAGARLP